jgi:hypothetical protein
MLMMSAAALPDNSAQSIGRRPCETNQKQRLRSCWTTRALNLDLTSITWASVALAIGARNGNVSAAASNMAVVDLVERSSAHK